MSKLVRSLDDEICRAEARDMGLLFFNGQTQNGVVIGGGTYGEICDIGSNFVAKIPRALMEKYRHFPSWEELRFAQEVYAGGVSCPKPYGLYGVPVITEDSGRDLVRVYPGIVMEKIQGVDGNLINLEDTGSALMQFGEEMRKLDDLGFITEDHYVYGPGRIKNAMWDSTKKKLYLIDFAELKEKSWRIERRVEESMRERWGN